MMKRTQITETIIEYTQTITMTRAQITTTKRPLNVNIKKPTWKYLIKVQNSTLQRPQQTLRTEW